MYTFLAYTSPPTPSQSPVSGCLQSRYYYDVRNSDGRQEATSRMCKMEKNPYCASLDDIATVGKNVMA